jgi:hypothetical protein
VRSKVRKNLPTKNDSEQYAKFLREIRLVGLAMENCSSIIRREEYFAAITKKTMDRSISSEYQLHEVQKEFFNVRSRFTLDVKHKVKSLQVLTVKCTFIAHFHSLHGQIPRRFVERFSQSELRLIMWPYFREFVSDMSSKMAIPPLLIPLATTL